MNLIDLMHQLFVIFVTMVTELLHLTNHCIVLIFAGNIGKLRWSILVLQGYLNKKAVSC